jgi:hypothetical protein
MKVKFEKGMTPEHLAAALLSFIKAQKLIIGSVSVYIQTYDEDMKGRNDGDTFICKPSDTVKKEYEEYLVRSRRKRMKAVV